MTPLENLSLAQRMKEQRSLLRHEVRALQRREAQSLVADMLLNPPEAIKTMQVGFLFQWIHGMKIDWIDAILTEAHSKWSDEVYCDHYKKDCLTPLKRQYIAEILRDWYKTW